MKQKKEAKKINLKSVNPRILQAKTKGKMAIEKIKKTDKGLVISFTKLR